MVIAVALIVLAAAMVIFEPLASRNEVHASEPSNWLSPSDLSPAVRKAELPHVAIDGSGNAIAIWSTFDSAGHDLQTATRAAGGSWSAPTDLSAPGQYVSHPQMAVNERGDAVAIWELGEEDKAAVAVAQRSPGGSWTTPTELTAPEPSAGSPQVAIDGAGDAIAVWYRGTGANRLIQASTRTAGGTWTAPSNVSPEGSVSEPHVTMDEAGDMVTLWLRSEGAYTVLQVAERPAGGSWGAPVSLSDPEARAEIPQMATSARGDVIAVWQQYKKLGYTLQTAERAAPGGAWSPAGELSADPISHFPALAMNAAGDAVAGWQRSDGTNTIARAIVREAGGSWSAPSDLSAAGQDADAPRLAIDGAGKAMAVWSLRNTSWTVQASEHPVGGSWSARTDLSAPDRRAGSPSPTMDQAGDGLVAWRAYDAAESFSLIQAAGYDAGPPQVGALGIPSTATVGQTVTFTASPFDVWGIASVEWSFGDGAGGSGATVTHAYAATGAYTVTLTARDLAGHATSHSSVVTVGAQGNPPGTSEPLPTNPPAQATRARIGTLSLTPRSFRAAARGPAVLRDSRTGPGARVRYSLNLAASVRFTVAAARSGRRVGKSCRALTRANRPRPRCTLYRTLPGNFSHVGRKGVNGLRFTGRLAGRKLPPGLYRLTAVPTVSGRRGAAVTVTFRIVR